jgi:hypothetical protein
MRNHGGQTVERKINPHGVLSMTATQSSPQLPRPNATRTILFSGNEILLAVM